MREERPARILYLVYWGALEPLGRSLVVPAVMKLAEMGANLTLVSFEKPDDLANGADVAQLNASFAAAGVRWQPLRYHKSPKWPATVFDCLAALFLALRLRLNGRFDLVHARTFVAGSIGYVISRLLGARFVYHNEGFYPDEQVDGGVWKRDSFVHRAAKGVEGFLYDHADGIIALSARAKVVLDSRPRVLKSKTPVIVVPSAVDLKAFQPPPSPRSLSPTPSLVYLGSVGFRYRLDDAGAFIVALRRLVPGATLTVVSRARRGLIESMLDASGLERAAWKLKELPHAAVPAELIRHDAGLLFWPQGLSEHGCSPTKVGEYWACGLPVVTTPNISDTDALVRDRQVGVVVDPKDPRSVEEAALRLLGLLRDPDLSARCRQAAESAYSLEGACLRQTSLYRSLTSSESLPGPL